MYSNRPRKNWGIIAVVSLLGISNISMMNTLVSHKLKTPFPNINLPVLSVTILIGACSIRKTCVVTPDEATLVPSPTSFFFLPPGVILN